jgi:hypothetical protein
LVWVLGWAFMFSSIMFYIYWILTWVLSSGNSTFKAWGINFGISFLEEFLMIQCTKVYLMQIATMTICLPCLHAIQYALETDDPVDEHQ